MGNLRSIFAENMKKYRAALNLSQESLALECELHRTYISDVERCSRNISIDNIERIATALSISPADLFKEDNK